MNQPLPVNEVFETIQGEAWHTGTPSIFIRLQGCGVGCPWCDTKHTWKRQSGAVIPYAEMLAKVDAAPTFALCDVMHLVRDVSNRFASRHVVITGGEPCDHDLAALTTGLIARGHAVQIETSGTAAVRADRRTWVTVSPKIDMPGKLPILRDALMRADEIKHPVGKIEDVAQLCHLLEQHDVPTPRGNVWLQPLSRSPKATALCIDQARKHGFRVSVQTHAFIGVR